MRSKRNLLMEFGSSQVKIGIAEYASGTVKFNDAYLIDLPSDTYHDGKIMDREAMRNRIANGLKEHQTNVKETWLTLNGSHIITREIILPDVKDDEISEMLQYEIEQYMPINLEQYVLEHRLLERFKEDEAIKVRVLVAAIMKADVDDYHQLIEDLGLKAVGMDVSGNALCRVVTPETSINQQEPLGSQTIAMLDIGHKSISVTIVESGILRMNRLVEAGLSELTSEEGDVDVAVLIQSWSSRIQRVFQFYQSRQTGNKIDRIYLFGGGADIEGLESKLGEAFGKPTEVVRAINHLQLQGKAKSADLKRYLNVAGLSVYGKQSADSNFNFFRGYGKQHKKVSANRNIIALAMAAIVIFMGAFYGYNLYQMGKLKKEMADMQAFMNEPANLAKYKKYEIAKKQLAILTTYHDGVSKINKAIDDHSQIGTEMIDQLQMAMPADLTIQNINLANGSITMQGFCTKRETVAEFQYNLKETGLFDKVFVGTIDKFSSFDGVTAVEGEYFTFNVRGDIKGGGANATR